MLEICKWQVSRESRISGESFFCLSVREFIAFMTQASGQNKIFGYLYSFTENWVKFRY